MDEADDPDPGGSPVHPALAFYGLWPRFVVDDDEAAEDQPPTRHAAAAAP